ncbi:hypothetical protein N665_0973s0005 [Sinapis alba]|nr:hypothetical protein N665_0973s0005 [Sinapis alba]
MSEELPKRIFKEGEETQVTHINNNCKIDYIIRKFKDWLPKELDEVKKDPVFNQIFKLHENGIGYSARVIHSFLCRELLTYKMHELWFVFARRPLRFSLQEFHAVTGFECNTSISLKEFDDWKDDGGFWSKVLNRKDGSITLFNLWNKHKQSVKKWRNADRIRLVYLAIILCVVLARDEKANIPLKYITMAMDLKKDDIYPHISCRGNMVVIQNHDFFRDDDMEDDRIKVLMELTRTKHDFSEHIWEFEDTLEVSLDLDDEATVNGEAAESDEDFQTPKGSKNLGSTLKKGTKRLPNRGMEKRKHKVLSSVPKQAPFTEEMKAFMTQLFEQNFYGMEQRLQKQMAETFENMKSELKDLCKDESIEVEHGEPSSSKPSTTKPLTSQPSLRRSKRGVSVWKCAWCEASHSPVDVNFSQADNIFQEMGTQGVEGLSHASYVPDFDPSQTNKEDDWWTPMTSVRGSKDKQTKGNTTLPPSQWEKWSKGKGKKL